MTNSNQPNQFHIQHVISPLPVFTTVLEDHETINKARLSVEKMVAIGR